MNGRLNLVLVLALAVVFGLTWTLGGEPTKRNLEFMPQMVDAVPAESFSESSIFADGKTMQPLPAHAIVRGLPPLGYGTTSEEAQRAGRELANPYRGTGTAALVRGAWVYATFCQVCHGPTGLGDGPVAQRGFPAPPSLLAEKALRLADGQIFHVVTFGQNNMPAYAAQVLREDRWRVVSYVRQLQAAAAPASPPPPPTGAAVAAPTSAPDAVEFGAPAGAASALTASGR